MRSRGATLSRCLHVICAQNLPHYIPSSPLVPSLSGGLILRVGYFWPSIFKDCVDAVKRCHPCQVFACNIHSKPTPLHPIITVGPFTKWGIYFMDCNLALVGGHNHIIVVVDYFTKWAETMPTVKFDGETAVHFIFN